MKYLILVLLIAGPGPIQAQGLLHYLKEHRTDVRASNFRFPASDFTIVGFGAYHGSAKTYEAEYALLASIATLQKIAYYIPETNYSQAWHFNQYLQTGDTILLRNLIGQFQTIVSQEGTIDTYQHWKKLKSLHDTLPTEAKFNVIGFDVINEYKFPLMHILSLLNYAEPTESIARIKKVIDADTSDFRRKSSGYLASIVKQFLHDNDTNPLLFRSLVKDTATYNHILANIKYVVNSKIEREKMIFDNYRSLFGRYHLDTARQFIKYGFSHILKSPEGNQASFFSRLIENKLIKKEQIKTVMGYLTDSEVLWDKLYDEQRKYKGFTTEQGFGIGDYWKERFKGIRHLKNAAMSDMTLFTLNSPLSPYHQRDDLIRVKLLFKKSNRAQLQDKVTTDFIDYALLIKNSTAQVPIEELPNKLN